MPSSRRLEFTREAEADIREILQYTRDAWGEAQRRKYAATLDASFNLLALFPFIGTRRDELSPGLRRHPVGEHVVYYRVSDDAVVIRRVFHGRRDVRSTDDID